MTITSTARLPFLVLALLAGLPAQAQAQAPKASGMEERLRAELRNVTAQLQQARGELQALKAAPAAPAAKPAVAAPASDAMKKELAHTRSLLAEARTQHSVLAEEQRRSASDAQTAAASLAQQRQASERLEKAAKHAETERLRLDGELVAQRGALAQCEVKNAQLYAAGKEILHAYESLDVLDVMRARQPFAAQSRVKLDQIAQQHGDRLYQGVFDARTPTAAPQASAPQ